MTVCPLGLAAANSWMAAGSGGCHACVHTWSEVGAPTRPVLPTPSTLKVSVATEQLLVVTGVHCDAGAGGG